MGRAEETTKVNDTCGLGAQPWLFLSSAVSALWQLMSKVSSHRARQTQGLWAALGTRDAAQPRGSSSCTHKETGTFLDQSGSFLLVTIAHSLDISTSV